MNGTENKIEKYREKFIRELNYEGNKENYKKKNADNLFNLGLTMYAENYSFNSAIYKGLASSYLDNEISLHPEQLKVLNLLEENRGLIFSAPTSFGKTFIVFEYIARQNPKNVVLVVPTLALVDEYKQRIIKRYRDTFSEYKIYTSIDSEKEYDFERKNLFILTHDRVVSEGAVSIFTKIDFLVIDEVYKLKKSPEDRTLVLNLAYKFLMGKSIKYLLLAPFLKSVENIDKLEVPPIFYSSNFSPVVNDVIVHRIPKLSKKEEKNFRNQKTRELINELKGTKTLVYFPTVSGLGSFKLNNIKNNTEENMVLKEFIDWATEEIHEEWFVVKAMKQGVLVHHGQLPLAIRMLQLETFDDMKSGYDVMLCTSTLLEGVNTSCENIIITQPARNKTSFDAFDFFNLVGRTGRLNQYYLGKAHYLCGVNDVEYVKEDALKAIEFELTDSNIDMIIHSEKYTDSQEYIKFLKVLGITHDDYLENFRNFRFNTVQKLFENFNKYKQDLYKQIGIMLEKPKQGKLKVLRILCRIAGDDTTYNFKLDTFIINMLTYKDRTPSIKEVVQRAQKSYPNRDINSIIERALKMKNSYIEYDFYKKVAAIEYFMKLCDAKEEYSHYVDDSFIKVVEKKYFMKSSSDKILKDMGVYERDIIKIRGIIKEDYDSVDEFQSLVKHYQTKIFSKISMLSRFVLEKLIK